MIINPKKAIINIANKPLVFYVCNLFMTYGVGFFIALFFLNYEYRVHAISVAFIILLSLVFFYFGWRFSMRIKLRSLTYKESKKMVYFFSLVFSLAALYVFKDNPSALFSSLSDTDFTSSELRALATKGKSGIDSIINGISFATSYVGLGMLAIIVFYETKRFKWFLLFIITVLLLLNGQKSRFIIAFLPVLILLIHQRKFHQLKVAILAAIVVLGSVMLIYNFSNFNRINDSINNLEVQQRLTTGGRDLFEEQTTGKFIIHRKIWIPFITAIDWNRYLAEEVGDDFLMGSSIPIISNLLGMERINLDNQVFKFQFGASQYSKGASNSFFAFDAMANFGWIGLIFFSSLAGFIFSLLWRGLPYPFNIMVFVWLYSFQSSSLHALFLGGGMFIPFFFILFKNFSKSKL